MIALRVTGGASLQAMLLERPSVGEERMLSWHLAVPVVSGVAGAGLGGLVMQRLLAYRSARNAVDAVSEAVPEWSVARYRPMARLLDSEDLEFLASRPGYSRGMGNQFRDSRRRIFRMYLAELAADFERLHAVARRMAAEAPEQHADLVSVLMRQQIAFWRSLAAIELRLALSWAGLAPASAGRLLDIVEQLQRSVAAAAPASASGLA